ncbi:MAG: sulfite exporter TauE/SafE family protein [Euryarchaeota archaeon]|nr:sulfite exporter TauE/SafE family protein [Euryarchaeota archaeon]
MGGFVPPPTGAEVEFIDLTLGTALAVALLGFIGGVLSGFLGSGGAFIMTPGMMNLGVPGILAVGSNITHKFGKAIVGSRSHGELGHVDKKLAVMMVIGLLAGVQVAVKVNSQIFESMGKAASNLYISMIFILVLTAITLVILRDLRREQGERKGGTELARRIQSIRIPPVVHFEVARIRVSLWFPLAVAFATGYLAGTIGVGGFIGVPAMIYLLGINTRVAAGTELFLAIFSGAWGAINYALRGYVDLRLVVLLYLGSLVGVQLGAIATEIVEQRVAKLALVTVIATSDLGRVVMIPEYLRRMGYIEMSQHAGEVLSMVSMALLFGGALLAIAVIFKKVRDAAALGRKAPAPSHH